MESKDKRRTSKRHPVNLKAAVVFDTANDRPILHTKTYDLSVGGTAIHSNYDDLTGSIVTLLLSNFGEHGKDVPKTLKIRARVISTVQSLDLPGYRHGLSFVPSGDDHQTFLTQILSAAELPTPSSEASIADSLAASLPTAPAAGGRLAQLKQLALNKVMQEKLLDPQKDINAQVSGALERAYLYLKELTDHLNILKPDYAKAYAIAGVPSFDGLRWEDGRVDSYTREISHEATLYKRVALYFGLSANKLISVTRESPANERLSKLLLDTNIQFTTREERNERGFVVKTTFVLPCEVKASLQLIGNFETGQLLLKTRNIERFGMLDHILSPDAITSESLDELAAFILGESMRLGPLLLRNV